MYGVSPLIVDQGVDSTETIANAAGDQDQHHVNAAEV